MPQLEWLPTAPIPSLWSCTYRIDPRHPEKDPRMSLLIAGHRQEPIAQVTVSLPMEFPMESGREAMSTAWLAYMLHTPAQAALAFRNTAREWRTLTAAVEDS